MVASNGARTFGIERAVSIAAGFVLTSLLAWVGNSVSTAREDVVRLKTEMARVQDDIADMKRDVRQLQDWTRTR